MNAHRQMGTDLVKSLAALCLLFALSSGAEATETSLVGRIDTGIAAPTSLAVSGDQIAVLEPYAGRITVFTADGTLSRRVDIEGKSGSLVRMGGDYLYCDHARGGVFAVEIESGRQFDYLVGGGDPVDLVAMGDELFVLDAASSSILVMTGPGAVEERIELSGAGDLLPPRPAGLAYDAVRDRFLVLDQVRSRVLSFTRAGEFTGVFCELTGGEDGFVRCGEIVCDADGYLLATDRYQGRMVVYGEDGRLRATIDPLALGAERLQVPTGLAVDGEGLVYVASTEGRSVMIYYLDRRPPLLASLFSPAPGDTVSCDGLILTAGVAVDGSEQPAESMEFRLLEVESGSEAALSDLLPLDEEPAVGEGESWMIASWELDDDALGSGMAYLWQARAYRGEVAGDWSESREMHTAVGVIPFRLDQNYPNPFNPWTVIVFSAPGGSEIDFAIYDINGRLVWRESHETFAGGRGEIIWNGTNLDDRPAASGVYFYRLRNGESEQTRKMVLVR